MLAPNSDLLPNDGGVTFIRQEEGFQRERQVRCGERLEN